MNPSHQKSLAEVYTAMMEELEGIEKNLPMAIESWDSQNWKDFIRTHMCQ